MKTLLYIFLFVLSYGAYSQDLNILGDSSMSKTDSIVWLRKLSKNKELTVQDQLSYAERAIRLSKEINIDTTVIKSNLRISSIHYSMKNYSLFKKVNLETLKLANKINDSISMAKVNFNIGNYFYLTLESDSAYYYYYNSEKIYSKLGDGYNAGRVLLNKAIIQKNEKDFIGSEKTSIDAISYIEKYIGIKENAYRPLASLCNNLAIVSGELENYKKAIEYYTKAIEYSKKLSNGKLKELHYLNNLAMIYEKSGDYKKALRSFESLLKEDILQEKEPFFYAMVLNNFARNKFVLDKDDKDLPKLYFDALHIRDSIKNKGGIMRSNIDLSSYYLAHDSTSKAFNCATKAYTIAKKYNLFDDQLETLLLLSNIEEGNKGLAHTHEYIKLNDSLQKEERAIRNKFARIEFETDKIEEENIKISREREWFLILSIVTAISAFLVYTIISQRAKNKELIFNQEQQKANEEIYNLMLSQQDKIEEGRAKEKKRISEDLHDGILGRLFGTRLSLDSLNFNSDAESINNRKQYIEELKSIEQEIRKISHDLNADFVADSGYLDIVKTLIETQTNTYGLTYNFTCKDDIDWETVSNKTKIHFYRMLQESLQNIYKHAYASHVDISFTVQDNQIKLDIVDNGKGFVVEKAKKGIGLKNIKSRVDELKGELFINSQKDAGTTISINVPI